MYPRHNTVKHHARTFDLILSVLGGLLILFILLPLGNILLTLDLRQLRLALCDVEVLHAVGLSLGGAAIATALALLGGIPLAYLLARRHFVGQRLIEALITLPIVLPHTAAGIALLLVWGRRGLVGRWLTPLGIILTDTWGGTVVGMLFVGLPFLVNMSRAAFTVIDDELEQAARIDGASPWQAFWQVSLPLAWRGILGGALTMWARGMSEFGAVVILAYHPKTAPVLVYERFQGFGLDAAQPVAVLIMTAALLAFTLLRLIVHETN